MNLKKSQSIIDFAIAIIAVAGLIVGIVRIWIWFNANYAKRQGAYQQSRETAGQPEGKKDIGYRPHDLTEAWVFTGKPSGTITTVPVGPEPPTGPGSVCDTQCTAQCSGQPACQDPETGEFNPLCDCYQACYAQCSCNSQIQPTVNSIAEQVRSAYDQADELRKQARKLRKQADEAAKKGDLKKAQRLRKEAKEIDKAAKKLENGAERLTKRSQQIQECCAKTTAALQQQCFEQLQLETCDEKCLVEAQTKVFQPCQELCGSGFLSDTCEALCQLRTDIHYNFCYASCTETGYTPCNQRVDNVIGQIQTLIGGLNEIKAPLVVLFNEINQVVTNCNVSAKSTCIAQCTNHGKLDTICYNNCYNTERNSCCRKDCCQGNSWGRDCDAPLTDCDIEECTQCPKCGLATLTSDLDTAIQDITTQISELEQIILDLPSCCSFNNTEEQDQCTENKISRVEK